MFTAKADPQFIKTSLLLLRRKGEAFDEILAFVKLLRSRMIQVEADFPFLTDFCGTGGDQKHTFNISTLAALVAAGAGAYVVKHGNRSVSSHTGSSDLMEKLGVNLKISAAAAAKTLKAAHFVYLHAPYFHPAFAAVQSVRRALKIKTLFNFLGPLLNPAKVKHQLIGVSDASLLEIYPLILKHLGARHAWMVMTEDGYDEISLTGKTRAVQVEGTKIRKLILKPSDFGLRPVKPKDLETRTPAENAAVANNILSGKERGPKKNVVLANAALGLLASGRAGNIREGTALARYSLESGKALDVLNMVKEMSRQ